MSERASPPACLPALPCLPATLVLPTCVPDCLTASPPAFCPSFLVPVPFRPYYCSYEAVDLCLSFIITIFFYLASFLFLFYNGVLFCYLLRPFYYFRWNWVHFFLFLPTFLLFSFFLYFCRALSYLFFLLLKSI